MQTWATLAAKHATLTSGIGLGAIPALGWESLDGVAVGALLAGVGFAVLNSPQRAQSCQLPLMTYERSGPAQTSRVAGGRLARVRRRVDGLLTGMLSDDSGRMTSAPATWQSEAADEQPLARGAQPPAENAQPDLAANHLMPASLVAEAGTDLAWAEPNAGVELNAGGKPDLAAAELEPDGSDVTAASQPDEPSSDAADNAEHGTASAPGERTSDNGFWGPGVPGSGAPTSGYRSKHRLDASANNARQQDSRRTGPRHAAPPAGFGAALSRSLTSRRLTSRSAAHAGG
jgi:hypothetical protein